MAGRNRTLVIALGAVALLLFVVFPIAAHLLTESLWFDSLGRGDVFSTVIWTRIGLGVVVGLIAAAFLYGNLHVATTFSKDLPPMVMRAPDGSVLRLDLRRTIARLGIPIAAVAGLVAGFTASEHWADWLRFRHGGDFGVKDPIFGRDVGFYVFDLPLFERLETIVAGLVVVGILASAAVYAMRGGLVVRGRSVQADKRVRLHLSVLVAALLTTWAFDAWLETARLLYSSTGPVTGASYADVHARLPMLRVQVAVAVVAAVLVLVSATRKRLVLAAGGLILYAAVAFIGVRIYPSLVQRFSVVPNEASKEAPFIRHNIAATRAAYGLDRAEERELTGVNDLTLEDVQANRATIDNIRLWDHQPLLDTFAQIQEIRTYYEFASVDNDRYVIDGVQRQTMLSPRELAVESLPNRTWINERFTFTHGYGLTLGPVNEATPEGLPVLLIKDIPPTTAVRSLEVSRPAIYFGELSNDYALVKTRTREFDHPSGDENVYAEYEGRDGVPLGSTFTRAAVAARIGSLQLLLSNDIDDDSRILLRRNIQDRISALAPFLTLDRDPYMVLRADGRLAWIQDAYTTTDRYPYAEATTDGINYIRNSVKIVLDAYDGNVDFYVADDDDPVLGAWRRAFPAMWKPVAEMPEDLRAHLRHPEDLFRLQAQTMTVYHMQSPELVYNREDQWEIPAIGQADASRAMEPYYTVMRLPGEREPEFILMLPFTPKRKDNLAAWMIARNDGEDIGELIVYTFPKDRLVFGPQQIMNRINQDAEISRQISLWDQRGSQAILGTLLVIPIEESLIYVCPLYLRSSGGRIPELKRVIVVHENRIAMEPTLDAAVARVFGGETVAAAAAPPQPAAPEGEAPEAEEQPAPEAEAGATAAATATAEPPAAAATPAELTRAARRHYDRAVAAQRRGDWAAYGQELEQLGEVLRRLEAGR